MANAEQDEGFHFLVDLRKFLAAGNKAESLKFDKGGNVKIFEKTYSRNLKSAYRIGSSDKGKREFYSVGSILFFLENENIGRGTYFVMAKKQKLQPVKQIDRKKLKAVLIGKEKLTIGAVEHSGSTHQSKSPGKSSKKRKRLSIVEEENKLKRYWKQQRQPLSTINTMLRIRDVDFKVVLQEVLVKYKDGKLKPVPPSSRKYKDANLKSRRVYPIIIVPGTNSSIINIGNVNSFLERGLWKEGKSTTDEVRLVRKNAPNGLKEYRVLNNINKLSYKDLSRVVCAFVQGQKWQFKHWPTMGNEPVNMATVFDTVLGVHVCYDGEKLSPSVMKWNVKSFKIRRQQRSMDQIQSHRIWEAIDTFIANKKPDLLF